MGRNSRADFAESMETYRSGVLFMPNDNINLICPPLPSSPTFSLCWKRIKREAFRLVIDTKDSLNNALIIIESAKTIELVKKGKELNILA